jgi:glycosyltransferase involved in cell wall biosynthesis
MFKVLVEHPDLQRLGGIEAYLLKLFPHLNVPYESFSIARRPGETGLLSRMTRIFRDYRRYWAVLSDRTIKLVHLNPSLERKSFYREAMFLLLARLRGKKTLVFFHGWNPDFQQRLDRNKGRLFRLLYGRADAFIVLAASFADRLRSWGIVQPIHSEVIVIEDDVIASFDLGAAVDKRLEAARWRVLFTSRLFRAKGIMTAIEALGIVQRSHPQFELLVAGDGELVDEARALVERLQIKNVTFLGVVSGARKYAVFRDAHLLCFPTEHGEGFPNVIVEAMAFGLPVITRPVGGIPDFFQNGVHGYLTESTAPEDFAQLIIRIAEDQERYRLMAHANHQYARTHFLASEAARRLERIYASI